VGGFYRNLVRILFRADRATSIEMRKRILSLQVGSYKTVSDEMCIGCGACANICPVQAIKMVKLEKPVEVFEGYVKTERPVIDPAVCVYCFNCQDYCPTFSVFGEIGAIHPREVGEPRMRIEEVLRKPVLVSPEKMAEIGALLSRSSSEMIARRARD